jgi:Ca2+:H+ antiporter
VIFALSAGEVVVAQTSILGSLFANALLVLGLVIIAGASTSKDGVMRFARRLPNDTATLLLLAVFIIVLLGLSVSAQDRAARHVTAISAAGAVILLLVYGTWLWNYLRADRRDDPATEEPAARQRPGLSLVAALSVLAVAGVAAAFVSEWFVDALNPAMAALHLSKAFAGLVVVAIAGNAVENVAGIALARKGKMDDAVSVVKNSVAQIAVFLFPLLVLVSLLFAHHLTFVLEPVYIGALLLTALAVWQVSGDGEATIPEGAALIGTYLILALLTFFE